MAISFAGVDLLLEDPGGEVARFLERYLPLEGLRLFGAQPVAHQRASNLLPIPNYPAPPPPRINSLYWPTGASRWAMGLFLADDDQKDQILEAVGGPRSSENLPAQLVISTLPDGINVPENSFQLDDPSKSAGLSTEMYLLPPRPISAGTSERLWLLPLVDERYWWQFEYVEEIAAATLSWNDVLGSINLAAFETPPAAYGDATAEMVGALELENSAIATDAAAHLVGMRFVRRIDGTIKLVTAAASETDHEANLGSQSGSWSLASGGDFSNQHPAAAYPQFVAVTFLNGDGDGKNQTIINASELGFTDFTARRTHSAYSGRTDRFNGDVPTAENQALAEQIATDFFAWLSKRYDYGFAGLKKWEATGFDDYVEWSIGRRLPSGEYSATTRVHSVPYNLAAIETPQSMPFVRALGKSTAAVAKGASGTFVLYDTTTAQGAETAFSPERTVSAYVRWGDYTANKWAWLVKQKNGWEVMQTECAD